MKLNGYEAEHANDMNNQSAKGQTSQDEITFAGFILSLGASGLMAMGIDMDNPASSAIEKEIDLTRAREIIDLVVMLQEKTRGNLNKDEENVLANILYTLRMKYMEAMRLS